ncbi:MAG: YadA-like family protein [Selenomonas sp.]|nr:YadA-like family protein [Acidaminococcaceae bacterium]MBO6202986.1 YadA-like family protein [Selenomonas sp.]
MNKIYKVIWSKAKNCYVVVSELAKRNGKCKTAKTDDSNRRNRLTNLLSFNTPALTKAVMAMLVAGMIALPNVAGAGTAYSDNNTADASGSSNASAYGRTAKATGENSTAIGGISKAEAKGSVAVGVGALAAVDPTVSTSTDAEGATAVGYYSKATGKNSIAVGRTAKANGLSAIAVGFNATAAAMGQNDAQATAYNEMKNTIKNDPAFAGTTVKSKNNYADLVAVLNTLSTDGTAAQKAAATSYLTQLSARVAALTNTTSMTGNYAIAVGDNAKAAGQDSIAVGRSSQAIAPDTIAVGRGSIVAGTNSIAVGQGAVTKGAYSVSIGQGARNRTAYGIAIGVTAGVSRAGGTTLPDAGGLTEGTGAIAIGYGASNFTYGTFQADDSYENVKNTVAIGTKVHTHAQNAVAIGAFTDATAERSFALGTASTNNSDAHKGSRAGGQGSVVIGDQAEAFSDYYYEDQFIGLVDPGRATDTNANDAIAVGTQARVMAKNAVAMGGNISYTGLANDPYGVTRFTTIYGKTNAGGETGAIVGKGADAGIAIGGAYGTIDDKGITIISEAAATYGMRGIAIGSGALVANLSDYDSIAEIINSNEYKTAKTNYETALSAYTNALNDCSVKTATYETLKSAFDTNYPTEPAEGDDLRQQYLLDKAELGAAKSAMENAEQEVSTAQINLAAPLAAYEAERIKIDKLEADDAIKVEDAVAIGANAKAGIARSIAMGSDSVTKDSDEAGTVTGVIGYDMGTGQPYAKDGRYSPTWMSTAGAFSVGGGTSDTGQTVTRRITNVAAGANDTDAVNVAQLKVAMDSTIMSSDNRNVGVGAAKERGLEIFSPYYHVTGIKDAAEASSFINKYETQAKYEDQLNSELTTLNDHKTRIEASIRKLDADLTSNRAKKQALEEAGKTNEDEYQEVVALISHLESELTIQQTELTQKQTEITNKNAEITNAGTTWSTNKDLYDTRAMASGTNATAIGYKAVANGDNTIAFGKEANAGAKSAIALGTGAAVAETGTRSISIGNKTGKVNGEDVTGSAVSGTDSISLGNGNAVSGNNSIAVGTGLTVSGNNSGAFGDPSTIDGDNSYSVGNGNEVGKDYSDVFALGNHITKVESNSVFLGSNSGYVPADNSSTAGRSAYGSMTIDDTVYPFAGGGDHVVGVISVGSNENGELITRRIQNVAPGLISADSTDAINGSQLYQAMQALSIDVKGDPTETQSTNVEKSKTPAAETAPAAGGDTPGGAAAGGGAGGGAAGTTMEIKLTPATTYTVTASTTTVKAGSHNIKVEEKIEPENPKSYKYTIDLAKDINVHSVTAGNTTINNDGLTIAGGSSPVNLTNQGLKVGGTTVNDNGVTIQNGPGMTKDGIDAGGKKITNVAKGEADTDAVNVGQMKDYAASSSQAINDLGDQISRADSRSRKGIAGAAALAALHPMDFDPDDKLTFAAGVGNFRGETAAAIGAFYRPDEKVMFSIGGTFGNSENLVNAGISFSLDRKSRVTGSRTAMAKEIVELREQVAQLTALVHQIAGNQGLSLPMPPAMFPNTPENKWAYDYIESLQKQGVLSGYAGRELTRNEMAAALDRALASGAKLDERITREFAPELSRIRVVYVNGQVDGEPRTFERPRSSVHEYK